MGGRPVREARSRNPAPSRRACLLRKLPTDRDEGDFGKWVSYSTTGTTHAITGLMPWEEFYSWHSWCPVLSTAKASRRPKRSRKTCTPCKARLTTLSARPYPDGESCKKGGVHYWGCMAS